MGAKEIENDNAVFQMIDGAPVTIDIDTTETSKLTCKPMIVQDGLGGIYNKYPQAAVDCFLNISRGFLILFTKLGTKLKCCHSLTILPLYLYQ